MEQPRTHIPFSSRSTGPGRPPLPRPVARGARPSGNRPAPRDGLPVEAEALYQSGRSRLAAAGALRRIAQPSARLTGLGTGVVVTAVTVAGGALDSFFTGGLGVVFGVAFITASVMGALWVRRADLAAAPVSAPIAFALALVFTGESGDGSFLGHLAGTVTGLATRTAWLYAGTVLAAAVVGGRKISSDRTHRRP